MKMLPPVLLNCLAHACFNLIMKNVAQFSSASIAVSKDRISRQSFRAIMRRDFLGSLVSVHNDV